MPSELVRQGWKRAWPLRSEDIPAGFPRCARLGCGGPSKGCTQAFHTDVEHARVDTAHALVRAAVLWVTEVQAAGGTWTIENPAKSHLWRMLEMVELAARPGVAQVEYVACAYGGTRKEHQKLLGSVAHLGTFARRCPGGHKHAKWGIIGRE